MENLVPAKVKKPTCACCSDEVHTHVHQHGGSHSSMEGHDHDHNHDTSGLGWKAYLPASISFVLLGIGLLLDYVVEFPIFRGYVRFVWYALAYMPVAWPVVRDAWATIRHLDFFNEFTLMVLATFGAFYIGEYPEGVAVMLFYALGELFQSAAVTRARSNIKALLDIRPKRATVKRGAGFIQVNPEEVQVGELLQVKVGERVPLDGIILSEQAQLDTAAITGEGRPKVYRRGEGVLAGMVVLDRVIELKTEKLYADSSIARILDMVQHASSRKAKTELLIRRFAKIYTPIVFFLALLVVCIPYFFVASYNFHDWLYRGLVFLVISCPCALVISIPLGFFGGIGAASRNGILFKGANFLESLTKVNTVVMDKTGTITKGTFAVNYMETVLDKVEFMAYLQHLERQSNHPIAKAILNYTGSAEHVFEVEEVKEIAGHGIEALVNGRWALAGNAKLLERYGIAYPEQLNMEVDTVVLLALDKEYVGFVRLADELKEDIVGGLLALRKEGVKELVLLSGDSDGIVQKTALYLKLDRAFGNLLPEQKVENIEALKKDKHRVIAFVGDGINDAPVLAISDVGIAMGAMGSDVAIETADVVIQDDRFEKVATSIKIGKATKAIVYQNIVLAFGVKLLVLLLGASGMATMWGAVFADVGVALLAILNAVRIQNMKFD
ncbi:heavy metal translocating P-type ATPase [Olivibacter sitiensis]|uniref:heavy metal translocating P-type ATPase n=1 Tax=Olivibacter sitiensis TaxID=376470 RepID=UPI000A02862D|nr:heavy metal translocating P-type ATPase [Olivibacter sitiensis]